MVNKPLIRPYLLGGGGALGGAARIPMIINTWNPRNLNKTGQEAYRDRQREAVGMTMFPTKWSEHQPEECHASHQEIVGLIKGTMMVM